MRSDLRTYWRDPGFWRWWWQDRITAETKRALAVVGAVMLGIAGYVSAQQLGADEAQTLATRRVVTVVRELTADAALDVAPSTGPSGVVTIVQTATEPGETNVTTVRRDGRTVVVRVPGETVRNATTVRGPAEHRVVTNRRTDTVVRTETAERLATVTTAGPTETITREVTQPARTVTETNAVTTTVTDEVTVTEQVTVTEAVTVTETVKK